MLRAIVDRKEYPETSALMMALAPVRERGWFNREELLAMGMWKSPRPKKHYLSNEPETVISISGKALAAADDCEKAAWLLQLNGVSLPVVSAILTLLYPAQYGVIDIRAWQLLHLYGVFKTNGGGQGFTLREWLQYVQTLREYASLLDVTPRDIERSLYRYHKKIQEGNLYN